MRKGTAHTMRNGCFLAFWADVTCDANTDPPTFVYARVPYENGFATIQLQNTTGTIKVLI